MEDKSDFKDNRFKKNFRYFNSSELNDDKAARFEDKKSFQDQKSSKDLAKLKKARIIVRNIPFGIDEQQLTNEFIKFGEIHEVIIPRAEDGRQKGFAFINFKKTMFAIKAVKEMNGKELRSNKFKRIIAVDFAMSKQSYINHMYSLKKIDILNQEDSDKNKKKENENEKFKVNLNDSSKLNDNELNDNDSSDESSSDESNEQSNEQLNEQSNEQAKNEEKNKLKRKNKFIDDEEQQEIKKPKKQSNDIEEGKTLFIRNLSFETNQEDLTELMQEFGELEYAIICMDKVTERSKGTGFCKFKHKPDADQCIVKSQNKDENEELFYLDGRVLDVQLAISKDQLGVKKLENEKLRDKRNLYLSKEGLIYPDSPAAENVSAEDLKKRLTLSQNKKKQLENLHYFVSKNRLCFHNLPSSYNDNNLRKLCSDVLKGEKDAELLFCKIMKNKDKTTNKFSTSKGFGFVSLSTHKHALRILRAFNNNPSTFKTERRPIVEFTVENMNAIKKNKQFIIKESLELGLENEHVNHKWTGFQSKPFGSEDNIINPITNKRMKDKKKKLQEKIKEQKVEKKEEKFNKQKKESIKLKKQRIEEHRPFSKKKQKNRSEPDPNVDREMKFLSKISNSKEKIKSNYIPKSKLTKKKKWFS